MAIGFHRDFPVKIDKLTLLKQNAEDKNLNNRESDFQALPEELVSVRLKGGKVDAIMVQVYIRVCMTKIESYLWRNE